MRSETGTNNRGRQTRQRILDAAARLLDENLDEADPFGHLELKQVAERAGLERNGLLHHFPTKQALNEALAAHLLDTENGIYDELDAESRDYIARSTEHSLHDAVTGLADLTLRQLGDYAPWNSQERLMLYASASPELSELARVGYLDSDHVLYTELFGEIMRRHGRAVRSPLTEQQVGAILQALLEGAAMRQRVDPRTFGRDSSAEPSLYARAITAILMAFTEPTT